MPKIKKGDIVIPRNAFNSKEFLEKCGWLSKKMASSIGIPYISPMDFIGKKCKVDIVTSDGTARIVNMNGVGCWWTKQYLTKRHSKSI